jgi:hypothetical protein
MSTHIMMYYLCFNVENFEGIYEERDVFSIYTCENYIYKWINKLNNY